MAPVRQASLRGILRFPQLSGFSESSSLTQNTKPRRDRNVASHKRNDDALAHNQAHRHGVPLALPRGAPMKLDRHLVYFCRAGKNPNWEKVGFRPEELSEARHPAAQK
jgi:hypothetical protein